MFIHSLNYHKGSNFIGFLRNQSFHCNLYSIYKCTCNLLLIFFIIHYNPKPLKLYQNKDKFSILIDPSSLIIFYVSLLTNIIFRFLRNILLPRTFVIKDFYLECISMVWTFSENQILFHHTITLTNEERRLLSFSIEFLNGNVYIAFKSHFSIRCVVLLGLACFL